MPSKIRVVTLVGLVLCCCVAVPAAYAQGTCNLQTLTGTWVGYEKGSSLNVVVNPPPQDFPFFTGAMAPFVNVVHVTFNADGIGKGYYWIYTGAVGATEKSVPVKITITEMNKDCTGKLTYLVPGTPPATVVERFIIFANGREIRSLPTSITNGLPGVTWTGTLHRISASSEPVTSCGQQTAQGKWLTTSENIVWWTGDTAWADTIFLRQNVSETGHFTGTLYEKLGDFGDIQHPIWGTIKVRPDCSFTQWLNIQSITGGVPLVVKGVYFNEGKEAYGMAIGIPYSFAYGERMDNASE